eukprot:scaffold7425_cov363-Prasinococcus_capsulatus_cf.AAC.1
MTFGVQNTQEQANELMDYYVKECGGNLLDVAEMYPAPASDPRWFPGAIQAGGSASLRLSKSEEIIGNWLAANPEWRSKVLIATKVWAPPTLVGRQLNVCGRHRAAAATLLTVLFPRKVMGFSPGSDTIGNRKLTLGNGGS